MSRLRSLIFIAMAVCASAVMFTMPATAAPIDPGIYVLHDDASAAGMTVVSADEAKAVIRSEAASLSSNNLKLGAGIGNRTPVGLSPEYAESLATDGLNFIDLRRRC